LEDVKKRKEGVFEGPDFLQVPTFQATAGQELYGAFRVDVRPAVFFKERHERPYVREALPAGTCPL